jgi:hypothetical protein
MRRNILIHGLGITLRRIPAFLWTYAFNVTLAILFSLSLHLQLATLLDHSLASQRLSNGFDLGAAAEVFLHLHEGPAAAAGNVATHGSIPTFFVLYFLLVPGTLFCYLNKTPARLSTLFHQGLLHFWRFVRITLVALLVSAIILGPLSELESRWSDYIDNILVGRTAFLLKLAALILVLLVASLLRLYFDLVEAYTVQLGLQFRPARVGIAKPDRRVRRTLGPAFRTLRRNFFRAWLTFLFLAILGAAAFVLSTRIAIHTLAQPRVWSAFLFAQIGLFLMLFTRFWQRGAEASLILQNPLLPPPAPISSISVPPPSPIGPLTPPPLPIHVTGTDPIPNPEPAPPSLDEPDPGVFHHDPKPPH